MALPQTRRGRILAIGTALLVATGVAVVVNRPAGGGHHSDTVASGPGEVATDPSTSGLSTSGLSTSDPATSGPSTTGSDASTALGTPTTAPGTTPGTSPTTARSLPAATTLTPPRAGSLKTTVVARGLANPTVILWRPGDTSTMYVAEQGGTVRAVRSGVVDATPVLDVTGNPDGLAAGGERGFLGLSFSGDGDFLYADWTDQGGDIHVVEYPFSAGRASGNGRLLLRIEHSEFGNHNGGNLVLGPDGMLWIGVGDGGSGCDPHAHAQDRSTLLGKVLRIDPTRQAAGRPYAIPAGNPFAAGGGAPEVWAFGLRNPWRFSFDRSTSDLWIGDVGQNQYEEVDRTLAGTPGGRNFGWVAREGFHPSSVSGCGASGAVPPGAVEPVFDYSHSDGRCSITGGYVYRGARIPALVGSYVFADYCQSHLLALTPKGEGFTAVDVVAGPGGISTFGQDPDGELYLASSEGTINRIDPV